jgi:hypothetical protein
MCRLLKAHNCLRRRRVPLSLSRETNSVTRRSDLGRRTRLGRSHTVAVVNESALKWAFHGDDKYIPNPDFRWTPELHKQITDGIPEENWGYFDRAHSEGHANYLRREMLKDLDYEKQMDSLGAAGTGLKLFGALVDPVGWAAAAFAAYRRRREGWPLRHHPRSRYGRCRWRCHAGNPGALNKPTGDMHDVLYAGAGGAVLGSAFGALARNPAAADLAEATAKTGKSLMKDIEAQAINGESSVGAAQASPRNAVRTDTVDWMGHPIEEIAPKSVMGKARIDLANGFGQSENPATRLLGAHMVEDTVGRANGLTTPFAVSESARKIHGEFEVRHDQAFVTNFKEWADDLNLNWSERSTGEGQFKQLVTDAMRNPDPNAEFHPAVRKQAKAQADLYGDYHDLLVNPGKLDGTTRRPVLSPDVPKSETYVPRIISVEKFQEMATRFGDTEMGRFIAKAVRGLNPDIDHALSERIGAGWYKRLRDVHAGQEVNTGRALFGEDVDGLVSALVQDTHMSNDEARAFVARFQQGEGEGGVSRTKHRTLMDENFVDTMKDQNGATHEVRLADMFENDSAKLFKMYNRQMSAQLALARLRIENPRWRLNPDSGPQWLVDGITNRGEWDTLMKVVSSVQDEVNPTKAGREALAKDQKRLQFAYDHITGQLDPSNQYMRIVRGYNFLRVMNQVGFAQIGDLGGILGQAGFRAALEGMPSLNALWRNAKTGQVDNALARDLEYITQGGTDWLRSRSGNRFDEYGDPVLRSTNTSVLDKAEDVIEKGKKAVNVMSFMAPINTYLQRWSAKASLARFINDATGASSTNLNRLRAMGLSEEMVGRIQNELKTKVQYFDSETRVGKVKDLNRAAWEPEARQAFEEALWRMSRRLVQENDIGQMSMWMNSDVGKMLMQFRSFMMGAWTKQFLYNINMRDWESFVHFSASAVLGAGVYIGQTHLQAIGRSDREKFLADRLSPSKVGLATFQRAGFASFLPMVGDAGAGLLGYDPIFDTRASGLSGSIMGNPTMDLFDKLHKGIGGAAETVTRGSPFTQPDARRLLQVTPFQNFLPWMNVYNTLISNLPEKETRKPR